MDDYNNDNDNNDQGLVPPPAEEEAQPLLPSDLPRVVETERPVKKTQPTKRLSSKLAPASVKRRRLVQEEEEADENQDPERPHSNQIKEINGSTKTTLSSKSSKGVEKGKKSKEGVSKTKKVNDRPKSVPDMTIEPVPSSKSKPLRQSTLVQLVSNNPKSKDDHRQREVTEDDDESDDSDFERTVTKSTKTAVPSTSSSTKKASTNSKWKGPSEETVKKYKQLQIHCLKYWGPAAPVSKPAAVRNQPPVDDAAEGSTTAGAGAGVAATVAPGKTVQTVLQIDQAPLSEMDVIAEAVRGVFDKYM